MERIIKTIESNKLEEALDFVEEVFTDSESKEDALIVRNLVKEIRSKKYYLPELELIMVNKFDEIIGYCMFSHECVMARLEKARYITLGLALVLGSIYFVMFRKMDYTPSTVLKNMITNFYAWSTVLAIFGFAKKHMDKKTVIGHYLAVNSYGYYVLHYPILMIVAYLLYTYTDFNILLKIFLTLVLELALTFIINEIIKRIPFIRYLILGIKRRKNEIQIDN